uniref:NADH:ubiquinone reductase (H(+)-translocating) n=1 Tax=Lepidotrema longipenis TaxID=330067 RepID=A0A346Q017_9PLAT|nr:NADH dehydrogenase subunit 5 [Lepidotrema longipenis]AXR86343.1 NADH dehydrogenase subunit 5 [Lepidotrema longipenis]
MFILLLLLLGLLLINNCYISLTITMLGKHCLDIVLTICENNIICYFMLFVCSCVVFTFSSHYFGISNWNLNIMILLFVFVMYFLISTNSLLSSLIGWEYLGVVSFFLILYYQNYDTFHAANVTLVSSRFGDVGLFFFLALINSSFFNFLIFIWLFVIIGSKSASYPFSSWLIEAMRAPTPVSSLVHSSTLVAAGVWFLNNYYGLIDLSSLNFILFFSSLTVFFSVINLLNYCDLKKLIALSTCNNINWCIIFTILGCNILALIQLMVHGIGKCLLFCAVGDNLNGNEGNQFSSSAISNIMYSNLNTYYIGCLSLLLAGSFFNGVYFSKHLFITYLANNCNVIFLSLLYILILGSFIYSIRIFFLFLNLLNLSLINTLMNNFFVISCFIWLPGILGYYCCEAIEEDSHLLGISSLIVFILPFMGISLGIFIYFLNNISNWHSLFSGQDLLVYFFYSLSNYVCYISNFISNLRLEINGISNLFIFLSNLNLTVLNSGFIILIFLLVLSLI